MGGGTKTNFYLLDIGKYREMGKISKNTCENVEKTDSSLQTPLFPQHFIYLWVDPKN